MTWRRKKTIVYIKEQVWFSLEIVTNAVAMFLIIAFLLFIPPMTKLMGYESLSVTVSNSFLTLVALKWPLVLVGVGVSILIGILQSHRLFGSVYAIIKVLDAFKAGQLTHRVRLRKYDYLNDLAHAINVTLDQQEEQRRQWIEKIDEVIKEKDFQKLQAVKESMHGQKQGL